jgi:predicted outer membrane repeat protein
VRTNSVGISVGGYVFLSTAGITLHVTDSIVMDNHVGSGGGIQAIGGTVLVVRVHFEANSAQNQAGAIGLQRDSILTVQGSAFIANRAPKGSAIWLSANDRAAITNSIFRDNVATETGGAIACAPTATLSIELTSFFDSTSPELGAALYLDRPLSVKILHSTFEPLQDGSGTVFLAGRLAGCREHPCSPGQRCSYANYSITCTQCDASTQSSEGLQCTSCGAGTHPNAERTGCEICAGNEHSLFGMCEPCPDGLVADNDHIGCSECGVHRTAVASTGQSKDCGCAEGYYDEADSVHICFRDGARASTALLVHACSHLNSGFCVHRL